MFYIEILIEDGRIWWYIDSYMVKCMVTACILILHMVGPPKYMCFLRNGKGFIDLETVYAIKTPS